MTKAEAVEIVLRDEWVQCRVCWILNDRAARGCTCRGTRRHRTFEYGRAMAVLRNDKG